MKVKKKYYAIPIIAVVLLGAWSILTPGTAIVQARVSLVAPYGNGFLQQVRTTQAFQTSDGGWILEVWSKCSLSLNQIVDISIHVSGIAFGSHPTTIEAGLYRENGMEFIPWDGC